MKIISKTPAENGAYPPLQDWPGLVPPEGYYKWPDTLDTADYYAYHYPGHGAELPAKCGGVGNMEGKPPARAGT